MTSQARPKSFRVLTGPKAQHQLSHQIFSPDHIQLVLAASGGPRWLGLVGIDRALFSHLNQHSASRRLALLGASSGAWRMAAWTCDNSGECYSELMEEYVEQRYEGEPTLQEVSLTCDTYLKRLFYPERIKASLESTRYQLNFTTALQKGRPRPNPFQTWRDLLLALGLNFCDRKLLDRVYQRGLFTSARPEEGLALATDWDAIETHRVSLSLENYTQGLLASGSIPTVLQGETDIPNSPRGHHFDGGIIDYHFEMELNGPIVYPHFTDELLPGWLDRFVPFRRVTPRAKEWLCIITPSSETLSRYSGQDFPSRHDFRRFGNDERIKQWRHTIEQNALMERELKVCLECGDLARLSEPLLV